MTEKEKLYQFDLRLSQEYPDYGKKIDWDKAKMFFESGLMQLSFQLSLHKMSLIKKRQEAFEDGFYFGLKQRY